ncbi:Met-10+ like-protein-domain-containing protein [Dioszegia hungarica]|uniref:tRNA (guanine(37)-N1)-methyltransferase n=1 Tax=Dioszegia hungarica TaxID=4972 RepID=A0AA38HEJ8_9TREE|nr:Met-10+ like-protein-domain-containing protein [Dioszegia hungarica]KAI9638795.1 Met-10+ like-protein-domain-containing protein [Dioszegia hungarica]
MSAVASSSKSPALKYPPESPSLLPKACLSGIKGLQSLDPARFVTRIPILCARVDPAKVAELKRHPMLRGQIIDVKRIPSVIPIPGKQEKLLRLRVESEDELPATVREFLLAKTEGFEKDVLELGYDYWSASDVLNAILPDTATGDPPSSFTQTGHIGHVNLRDEWLPYKHLIGQVLLDKNHQMRTIVNKLDTIHAEYRYFDMEVLAGEPDFVATVNEGNCTFTLDFRSVYWNSRLGNEHDRLVSLFAPGEVVADVMAGVGPFAIPAAKKGCRVLGNDLNPEGVKWMAVNREKNKVQANLRVSETDGRAFIRSAPLSIWNDPFPPVQIPTSRKKREKAARLARTGDSSTSTSDPASADAVSPSSLPPPPSVAAPSASVPSAPAPVEPERQEVSHFVMNLPDSALTFLDAYRGAYNALASEAKADGYDPRSAKMPMVHVHCFTREMERPGAEKDICQRASKYLKYPLDMSAPELNLHFVRSVAPNKDMYCLSFRLPREVAFARD